MMSIEPYCVVVTGNYRSITKRTDNWSKGFYCTSANTSPVERTQEERIAALEAAVQPREERLRAVHRPTCRLILELVSLHTGVSQMDILGSARQAKICRARHVAFLLAHEVTGQSYPQIAKAFDRDHTSIMHGVMRARDAMEGDPALCQLVNDLRALFKVVSA
jgi:chromosomal replication initiation ATPase DnaA